jgi:hypothetical protein
MNRTTSIAKRGVNDARPPAASPERRPATHQGRRSTEVVQSFRRVVRLSRRQLQVAYPYVAFLLQALAAAQQRRSARRRGRPLGSPRAARA